MPIASCHCGTVRLEMPPLPDEVAYCSCSICRRYGALWAYYPAGAVRITAPPGSTESYVWGRRTVGFVRCRQCGCVTHWEPLESSAEARLGVNARNLDPDELELVNIRWLDSEA